MMGPELDLKEKNGDAIEVPKDNLTTCTCNYEDNAFHMDASAPHYKGLMGAKREEDVQVNITDNVDYDQEGLRNEGECRDATESSSLCSSSFGGTNSGEASGGASGDVEVESQLHDDGTSTLAFDGFSDLFRTRKKKITAHWRNFIRPIMWRCRWVELQVRELQSQALKYDSELAKYDRKKQLESEKPVPEDLGMKSAPFSCQNRRAKVMKRKKRKRVEEAIDMDSYMACHNLFSYYVNKRRVNDVAYMDDDHSNPANKIMFRNDEFGSKGEWPSLEFNDNDDLEYVLRKIDEAQSQVRNLRDRMDKVISDHSLKDDSNNSRLHTPDDELATLPDLCGENVSMGFLYTSQRVSEKAVRDLVIPKSAVSSYGEVDVIESKDQPQVGPASIKMEENEIPIHNQPVKDLQNPKQEVTAEPHQQPSSELESDKVPEPDTPSKTKGDDEQRSSLKLRSVSKWSAPRSKRKRGRGKARSSKWSKRSSG